ncbi:FecR family protein [Mucilaginibacter gracilis]|uniref:FecR family protein n=1 Tax=Mucilaginibacter gracilis TaxID=423350 RepID=A0A495J7M9_9SPHI|nr:FecR family protein [Mucilaginibacter gracilis]RKR84019.1 FecR family protein [Mucilaginibacter gracilis]
MQGSYFKNLLEKLFQGEITYEQYLDLKDQVKDSTDEEISSGLQSLWDGYSLAEPMELATKFGVLSNIHQQIGVENTRNSRRTNWWRYAAVLAIPLLIISTYYAAFHQKTKYDFTVLTSEGEKSQLLLPDGTKVWLNSGSKITYANDFSEDNREVRLIGEAFFEVKKDAKHRFVVATEQVNVEVHGTEFNVSAYPDERDTKVSLLSGKISLIDPTNNKTMATMKPGYQVAVNKNLHRWLSYSCDVETEALWVKSVLRFENAAAGEVFTKLEHWYGIKIHIENPDTSIRYGFTLKSESIREMLDLINKITPINYKINGEEVFIRYK